MTTEELKTIIENHGHWLRKDCDGWEDMRADLSYADLRETDLSCENLAGASLFHAGLARANLSNADLTGADLSGAILNGANMSRANLYTANLTEAELIGANLWAADLDRANLQGTNLNGANLSEATLHYAENLPMLPYACPDTGSFIGWKKARYRTIVCLEIPEDAKRLSGTGRKCRCDRAKVLSITKLDGQKCNLNEIASHYDENFIYRVGETVSVPDFDENRWNECSTGIHFFINREEAVVY